MDFFKLTFSLLIVLLISVGVTASPVPIEEICRRLKKDFGEMSQYNKAKNIQVMVEFGVASWYECPTKPDKIRDSNFRVDDTIFPVAHKTLPFGTLIKVINPENGRKILTRVIDRGPYISGRIIDLDGPGAKAIGISGIGKIILKIFMSEPNSFTSRKLKKTHD
ncbi:hypothetical protein HYY75_03435 [bacterium]|nr:hypothetical protein [bacterium]